jgi:hypothetical protein
MSFVVVVGADAAAGPCVSGLEGSHSIADTAPIRASHLWGRRVGWPRK